MRKVFLDDLPTIKHSNKVIFDWKNSIRKTVKFIYDNVEGYIEICDYGYFENYKNKRIVFRYKDRVYTMGTSEFINGSIGNILKLSELSNEEYIRIINNKSSDIQSLNTFILSDDSTYYTGYTQKNEIFIFDNDEKYEYIKSFTWRITNQGYVQNNKGEKLHRVVMGVKDREVFVNHIGGNKYDCRKSMLSISDSLDNSKEKKISSRNNSGIVGLMKRGKNNKWVGNIKINDLSIYSKYKTKDEALLDLLIMQKHYGFRHNENLFSLIDDVSTERYNEVIDNCERQLHKNVKHTIKTSNQFELSKDKSFYWVYDDNDDKDACKFKVSISDIDKIIQGKWHIAYDKSNAIKTYIHGSIIINNKRKTVKLHRYLFNLLDDKYKLWFIDHVNGDELDNRRENLIITDALGNGVNKKAKGYYKRNGKFRINLTLLGVRYNKTVDTEIEAIELVKKYKCDAMENRIQFNSKEELDEYINKCELDENIA